MLYPYPALLNTPSIYPGVLTTPGGHYYHLLHVPHSHPLVTPSVPAAAAHHSTTPPHSIQPCCTSHPMSCPTTPSTSPLSLWPTRSSYGSKPLPCRSPHRKSWTAR